MTAQAHHGRVMVVDDEPLVRDFVGTILAASGYNVVGAPSAREAIRMVDAGGSEIDLLVTDIVMPDIDGCELAIRMRQRRPALPVLFISGYQPNDDEAVPKDCFLQKPFRIPDLLERIRFLIG
jgi:CheY-like chemotaxis protein